MSDLDQKLPIEHLSEKAPSYEEATLEEAPSKQLDQDIEAQTEEPKKKCRKALWIILGLLFVSPIVGMSLDACNEMMENQPHQPHHDNPHNTMMPAGDRHGKHGMMRGRPKPCDDNKEMQTVRVHYILPSGEHKVAEIHGGRFFPGQVKHEEQEAQDEQDEDSDSDSDDDSDDEDSDDEEEVEAEAAPVPQIEVAAAPQE